MHGKKIWLQKIRRDEGKHFTVRYITLLYERYFFATSRDSYKTTPIFSYINLAVRNMIRNFVQSYIPMNQDTVLLRWQVDHKSYVLQKLKIRECTPEKKYN